MYVVLIIAQNKYKLYFEIIGTDIWFFSRASFVLKHHLSNDIQKPFQQPK